MKLKSHGWAAAADAERYAANLNSFQYKMEGENICESSITCRCCLTRYPQRKAESLAQIEGEAREYDKFDALYGAS